MRPVAIIMLETQLLNFSTQLISAENTQMTTRNVVILFTQGPADFFRPAPGNTGAKQTARLKHTLDLTQRTLILGNMLQHFQQRYHVERVIIEVQVDCIHPPRGQFVNSTQANRVTTQRR